MEDVDIIRLLAIDNAAEIHFDSFFEPQNSLSEEVAFLTGVTAQNVEQAPPLGKVWTDLLKVISGKYIVAYNFDRVYEQLRIMAKVYDLEVPVLFGTSLGSQACDYFEQSTFLPLEKLCVWTGYLLPPPPGQTALHRARAQLHILQTMAQGVVTIEAKRETINRWRENDEDREELDDEEVDEWVDGTYE